MIRTFLGFTVTLMFLCVSSACIGTSTGDTTNDNTTSGGTTDDGTTDDGTTNDNLSDDTPSESSAPREVAEAVAVSAGSFAGVGVAASADILGTGVGIAGQHESPIPGFTFDPAGGVWNGTTQFDATPSLRFYLPDGSLIMVDVTDEAHYFPGAALFGQIPPGVDATTITFQITVEINATFDSGSTMVTSVQSDMLPVTQENTDVNAPHTYTGDSGTVTGESETLQIVAIELVASDLGETVSGSYEYTAIFDGETFTGTAKFDRDGCDGATVIDASGTTVGTAELNEEGALVFTLTETGEKTQIPRIER